MATKKPKGLGMGLEALLGPKVSEPTLADAATPHALPIARLRAGRYQPRTRMDEGSLHDLADSIRSQGVMQPILVRPLDGGDGAYEIIAGERRFRAAQIAGLDQVPVIVRAVSDDAAAVMALIENIQREDLNPLEEAQGLQRLVTEFKLTHEQAAQAVGRSRSAATNLLRLLQLAEPVQQMLLAGDIEMGHARALLALPAAEQVMSAQEVAARKLSVRETEKLVARRAAGASPRAPSGGAAAAAASATKPRDVARLEERLADQLAAPVEIRLRQRRGGASAQAGEIAIRFDDYAALDALLHKLGATEV